MADISKIQVPGSATQYNIKDAQARRDIEDVKADLDALEPSLLSDNAKEALLACLENVAYKNGAAGSELVENLREALYEDFYEREEWKFSSGDISKMVGTVVSYTGYGPAINTTSQYRRAFFVNKGKAPYVDNSNGEALSGVYPIPVPTGYNKAVVTITPNTQYINLGTRSLIDGQYSAAAVNFVDYAQGTNTINITVPETGRMFLTVSSKYNSAGTSYPTEPTELTVTFSKEV